MTWLHRLGAVVWLLLALSAGETPAIAAPSIANIFPPALQVGASVTLKIDGAELAQNPRLLLPIAIAEQTVKPGGAANSVQIDVKLAADTMPGIYLARIATDTGVSNAFPLAVDSLATIAVQPNLSQLPVALAGDLTGATVVRTTFAGKMDQPILVEVESQRLGGKLRPVVRLLDARGVQVAFSQGERRLGGDAQFAARLPAEGMYTIELQDLLFRGEGPGRFRLKVGDWKHARQVMPLGVQRGSVATLTFDGGNLEAANSEARTLLDARGLDSGLRPAPWPTNVAASGSRPAIVVSDHPEIAEAETAGAAMQQLAAAPIGVSGRLTDKGEEDRFVVPVTPGVTLRIAMQAEQLGSPVDGVLIVRNAAGGEMARGDDDRGTTDPAIDFKVPAGVASIVVAVKDLLGRGGRGCIYRLSIAPIEQQGFNPTVAQDVAAIGVGGRTLWRVAANRAGYGGAIRIAAADLPGGVKLTGGDIPAGMDQAFVVLTGEQAAVARAALSAEAVIGDVAVKRRVQGPNFPAAEAQPWLREELAVASVGKSPLAADWADAAASLNLPAGGKTPAMVKVTRSEGIAGPIRLTLLTNQTVPKKKVDNRDVDDEAKALRAEAIVAIPAEANEAAVAILVPADLARLPYDLVVQADLLSADGNQVLATTYTLPKRAVIVDPPPQ
jgi:hypothetical protein